MRSWETFILQFSSVPSTSAPFHSQVIESKNQNHLMDKVYKLGNEYTLFDGLAYNTCVRSIFASPAGVRKNTSEKEEKCSRVGKCQTIECEVNCSTAKKMSFWLLFSTLFTSAGSSSSLTIVAPFASAGIRPAVHRLNQDTTVYYGLVFCAFS